jgi:general stress protein CsbA
MNTIHLRKGIRTASVVPAPGGGIRDWQRWAPSAAVAWSLIYAALGIFWAVSGRGFPYPPDTVDDSLGPLLGRFGAGVAWIVVILAGIPAAALGAVMLRGVRGRALRPLFIIAGMLLAGVLLLLMIEFALLIQLAYIPFVVFNLLIGAEFGQVFLEGLIQSKWTIAHQVLCLTGGFLWLAATLIYARRSEDACLYCGRRDGPQGWTSPENAARWGRIAVYVAMLVPMIYALTRYAWALGFPLGMTEEYWRQGQERGEWISGLFLANFALVGAVLMLGLVQRWGEVFPRWIVGLAGRRVPIVLAVVPASIMSVLFMVGGIAMWFGYSQAAAAAAATEQDMVIVMGPVFLFPVWAVALAMATLGYYYRRRGPCNVCGRGTSGEVREPSPSYQK